MSFDDSLYDFDRQNRNYDAKLKNGAILYRLTSLTHTAIDDALNGGGALNSPHYGRFNVPQQRATYCANNVIVCISEVLYHMYRTLLTRIENCDPAKLIRNDLKSDRVLMVFRINEIDNIVYIDGTDVSVDIEPRMRGTATVLPVVNYHRNDALLARFNNSVRNMKKRGVLYPSARHSKDLCVAFFEDETKRIVRDSFKLLRLELRLISELERLNIPSKLIDPFEEKINPTMGYYEFQDSVEFVELKKQGIINPAKMPEKGVIDFVRRQYVSYSNDAVRP